MERWDRWQRVCAALSVIGLLAAAGVVFHAFPQTNPKLAQQLAAAKCQPVRALRAEEISPHALSKEHYALYMQCDELFWYRARYPEASLTLAGYEDQIKHQRRGLILRALLYWLLGVALLFLAAFLLVRAFARGRQDVETHGTME